MEDWKAGTRVILVEAYDEEFAYVPAGMRGTVLVDQGDYEPEDKVLYVRLDIQVEDLNEWGNVLGFNTLEAGDPTPSDLPGAQYYLRRISDTGESYHGRER